MFILEKPYASEQLIDSIVQNDWPVLENQTIDDANIERGALNFWSSAYAKDYYLKQEYPLIYSNAENAISWVLENLPRSNLSSYIKLFKDKVAFREFLKELYPNFYFKSLEFNELKKIKPYTIKFPVVLKPAVGFLSFGVHNIYSSEEWDSTIKKIEKEMTTAGKMYSKSVVDSSKFLIEEMIEGEEFAVDAYYDRNGEVVILNIFQHPFNDKNDVKDRIYLMSADIMVSHMAKFSLFLGQIGDAKNIRNFPMHVELRVTPEGEIIPIEINPMRFAGWCTTDVGKYAWGINVYDYFQNQKRPDWNEILSKADKTIYYFSMAEVPSNIAQDEIVSFDYRGFLSNYSNVLELRKIDYKCNPLFAIIFGSTQNYNEINRILKLKTSDYIETPQKKV